MSHEYLASRLAPGEVADCNSEAEADLWEFHANAVNRIGDKYLNYFPEFGKPSPTDHGAVPAPLQQLVGQLPEKDAIK